MDKRNRVFYRRGMYFRTEVRTVRFDPKASEASLEVSERTVYFSARMLLIGSEMAGPIGLKLGGMVEGICENNLPKHFFLIFGIQDGYQMDYI